MRIPNVALRRVMLPIIIAGIVLCTGPAAYLLLRGRAAPANASAIIHAIAPPKAVQGARKTVNAGLPVRLKIPKINVDAALDHVGLTTQGDLAAPQNPANAAWYTPGPRPGDSGNAVIDGHYGYKDHVQAVFDKLYTLKPGDNLYVEDEQGKTVTFAVRELRTYRPNEDTADVFRPNDGGAHLNLITCKGAWNKDSKSYSARLVVFADKIIE